MLVIYVELKQSIKIEFILRLELDFDDSVAVSIPTLQYLSPRVLLAQVSHVIIKTDTHTLIEVIFLFEQRLGVVDRA